MPTPMTAVLEKAIRSVSACAEDSAQSDRELLLRFAEQNDQSAFTVLVQRYSGMVLGVCRRSLTNIHDAEDACQATFLVLARKAATGRWSPSLANWLYTTARRVASNSRIAAERRARRESRPALPEAVQPVEQLTGREVLAALDEELDRLHARYREPLVLCYLEGLTRDEAAVRLGIPPGTVKTRLERGRLRLHDALTQRGLTLGAGLLALTVVSTTRAASSNLVKGILAAVGGSPSEPVAELARGVIMNAFMHRLFRLSLAAAAIVCLGIGVWAAWPAAGGQSPAKGSSAKAEWPIVKPELAADKEGRAISGRVVDSAGKPVAKAAILIVGWEPDKGEVAKELATTDANGRFRCVVPPPGEHQLLRDPRQLVAGASGYAADWIPVREADSSTPVLLRLGTAKLPVRGRVLTLEGKPIPNARVQITSMTQLNTDGFKNLYLTWNGRYGPTTWRKKRAISTAVAGLPKELKADAEGRFEITGVGDGYLLRLTISAETIQTVHVGVVLDPAFDPKAVRVNPPGIDPNTDKRQTSSPLYGPTFVHIAQPCRVIEGRVFDQKTKKPLSGISITPQVELPMLALSAQTDAAGRFRITGVANTECDLLFNYPESKETPYLTFIKTIEPTTGLAPATVEMPLVRGTVITGRATDKITGKPIRGAVSYYILQGNKYEADLPAQDIHHRVVNNRLYNLDSGGQFRFVALPGLGIITFGTHPLPEFQKPYPPARISDADRKKPYFRTDDRGDRFVISRPALMGLGHANAYRVIEPEVGQESLKVDFQLDPGKSITGRVVGPDGKPLSGVRVSGLTEPRGGGHTILTGAAFVVEAILEDDTRTVVGIHADKKLAGSVVVRGNSRETPILRMATWGAVMGRLVDKDGRPISGVTVRVLFNDQAATSLELHRTHALAAPGMNPKRGRDQTVRTDAGGRFRVDVPFAGMEFRLWWNHKTFSGIRRTPGGTVKPGETKDLGDIALKAEE